MQSETEYVYQSRWPDAACNLAFQACQASLGLSPHAASETRETKGVESILIANVFVPCPTRVRGGVKEKKGEKTSFHSDSMAKLIAFIMT